MACLFGLGLGLALSNSKKNLGWIMPCGLLILSMLISFAEPLHLVHVSFTNPAEYYLIGASAGAFQEKSSFFHRLVQIVPALVVLIGTFYLIVATFASIGQQLGRFFDRFEPLVAYSINIAGSLAGISLFVIMSFLSLKPEIWLGVTAILSLCFWHKGWQIAAFAGCIAVALLTSQPGVIWSPYYRIHVEKVVAPADGKWPPFFYGYELKVNHDTIEGAVDNSPQRVANLSPAQRAGLQDHYDQLYELIGSKPRSVLVLAAGAGNDLAAALRHQAYDIDAVEIDPVILKLGRQLHPEKPYDNPAVHVIVDDARVYLKQSKKKYDLVDFSLLDSHSAFSSMSSIRLDNYVYTVQSFQEAAKLLKPDGIMAVTFFSTASWQDTRLFKTLTEALGYEPIGVYSVNTKALTFLTGPGVDRSRIGSLKFKRFDKEETRKLDAQELADWDQISPTTDDWPFLFLRRREMTLTYAAGLILTLCLGWRLVRACFGQYTTDASGRTMFYLGAGFMLVEVKSISQMGLLAGTTWLVNSTVIAAIMLMILIANCCQLKFRTENLKPVYAALALSLIGSYFTPLATLNQMPMFERLSVGGLILALPICFASWIFAATFSKIKSPHNALGMNLLGTLFGGVLEYTSMILGISAMNLVAVGLYALAFYYWHGEKHPGLASTPELTAQ